MTAGDPSRSVGRRLHARAVHRVTPEHVGERVSVRHLVTDPQRGPVPTDVVGRLIGYQDGVLTIVDRDLQLSIVAETAVVSSRVVPPHPRRAAEPTDLGTRARPLPRRAARVLLVDDADRTLLVAHHPGDDRTVWTAPGGGLRPGEDHVTAARRELNEELALELEPGPCVFVREETFDFAGVWLTQAERWFLTRVPTYDATAAPLDDAGIDEARWWTVAALRTTDAVIAPAALGVLLEDLLRDGPPDEPIEAGR